MIDRDARNRLGRLMRDFATGKITNHELDDSYEDIAWHDRAIVKIAEPVVFSSDFEIVRLVGNYRLDRQQRRVAARWLLFLQTDLEFVEPSLPWRERVRHLLSGLTCGFVPKSAVLKEWEWHEEHVWPFLTPEQLQEARVRPRLLCGRQQEA